MREYLDIKEHITGHNGIVAGRKTDLWTLFRLDTLSAIVAGVGKNDPLYTVVSVGVGTSV
ncbi:hypothetical protein [Photorhabdus khanii]|uniref:hypothetical protein n=1 Tax=Photorhabdus khanii TaxID=1004150 RepID=UPI00186460E1|nr:hypothetical protein [Photorhabdus khanii]